MSRWPQPIFLYSGKPEFGFKKAQCEWVKETTEEVTPILRFKMSKVTHSIYQSRLVSKVKPNSSIRFDFLQSKEKKKESLKLTVFSPNKQG